MKIDYANMPIGASKLGFRLRYILNVYRTWYYFNIKYPWIKYKGFVRVMPHTTFTKSNIELGTNVQFGPYCNISTDVKLGNNVLLAGRVCIIGRNDHQYDVPKQLIWNGARCNEKMTIVEDDVWIGHNCTILAGVTISKGSIIAAGSLVNKSIPSCEIWGGVPAKKIRNRFDTKEQTEEHLNFLISK